MALLTEHFKEELEEISRTLRREIKLKAAEFDDLVELNFGELENNACSLIVLSISQAFGGRNRSAISLAIILQYIFMADQVHRLMTDDPDLEESKRQFPVLVGDFLYGKFFLNLCKEKMLHFLAPLAKIIESMNQGAINRWLAKDEDVDQAEFIKILEMERAALTGLAARLGAELAGCPVKVQNQCEVIGWNLGLAWAASQDHVEDKVINHALHEARNALLELPNPKGHSLGDLIDYIESHLQIRALKLNYE
ncbi:MAG: geranylgeranyl pyrophosphate synthase [Desulfitobacterium sp.]